MYETSMSAILEAITDGTSDGEYARQSAWGMRMTAPTEWDDDDNWED